MAYVHSKTLSPDPEHDMDMWAAEISFYPNGGESDRIRHDSCIEVYAEDNEKLMKRVNIIVEALNDSNF